ncbi:MAG: hypothetical protein SPI81_00275 [Candidatus Faecousia sp.]|nr:hypothetical protein [Candidatus Faecousia sp.]
MKKGKKQFEFRIGTNNIGIRKFPFLPDFPSHGTGFKEHATRRLPHGVTGKNISIFSSDG